MAAVVVPIAGGAKASAPLIPGWVPLPLLAGVGEGVGAVPLGYWVFSLGVGVAGVGVLGSVGVGGVGLEGSPGVGEEGVGEEGVGEEGVGASTEGTHWPGMPAPPGMVTQV